VSCEDDLARARIQLGDLSDYLTAAMAEMQRVYDAYIAAGGARGAGSGSGSQTIGAAQEVSANSAAASSVTGAPSTATTEEAPQVIMSPVVALTKRASTLSARLALLEART